MKRLQHSYQDFCQQNGRIFKFLSPMHFTHINFLPARSNKNISHPFKKMAAASIDNLMPSGYDAPQSEEKQNKSSLNASSPETASCIWVRFTPKNKLTNLVMKKWINSLIIMKLNSQDRWYSLWGNPSSICIQWELVQL